jgi:retron-type reverse transcriptase
MSKLAKLRRITTKRELAELLGVNTAQLTYILYKLKPEAQYVCFSIPKKSGGIRIILSPTDKLKSLQASLSRLLLDCIDEVNTIKYPAPEANKHKPANTKILKVKTPNSQIKQPSLSHGFVRHRSIITNAMMHLNKKNVLNIDLKDFFDSFNFGRVRGFFIKNNNFELDPHIATVIAQIACYDNKLPQGSPCSPVITNLITHSLDIKLASLAKKHSCTYTRYADDMTFSTRKKLFPRQIMGEDDGIYIAGKKLKSEIKRAGFSINEKKTRIQHQDSRQDVTGLIVNKKPNVKKEYWRTVKSQCHILFRTGAFTKTIVNRVVDGNINELEGQLNFIDQIDQYNRLRQKPPLNPAYTHAKNTNDKSHLLSGREKTFSRFLYYRLFYANTKPTLLCEGKTDNVYLKSAISELVANYPQLALAGAKTKKDPYKLLVRLVKYTNRTRFLLGLYGGTTYLNRFIREVEDKYKYYKDKAPENPVIVVVDNDSGFSVINEALKKVEKAVSYPLTLSKDDYRSAEFIHVIHNLYVVLTPLGAATNTAVEDLFDNATRQIKVAGKSFNPCDKTRDNNTEYSKEIFANKVIKTQKSAIDFSGLKPLLDRIVGAIKHYESIKTL